MGIRDLMVDGCGFSNLTGCFSNLTGLEDLSGLTPEKASALSEGLSDPTGSNSNLTAPNNSGLLGL